MRKAYELKMNAEDEQLARHYLDDQGFLLDDIRYYMHVASDEAASKEEKEEALVKCDECLNRAEELRIHAKQLGQSPSTEMAAEIGLLYCLTMERPDVKWDVTVGLEETWKTLLLVIRFPIKFPHLYTDKRKQENVLLIGDFEVSKYHLVKAAATGSGCSQVLHFASTKLFSRRKSKRLVVQRLFKLARQNKPCIVFIDDVDRFSICRPNSAARREFLTQTNDEQSMNNGVFVIGSSRIQINDNKILSRFQKTICGSFKSDPDGRQIDYGIGEAAAAEHSSSSCKGLLNGDDVTVEFNHGSSPHNISTLELTASERVTARVGWESISRALCVSVCRPLMTIAVVCLLLCFLILFIVVLTSKINRPEH